MSALNSRSENVSCRKTSFGCRRIGFISFTSWAKKHIPQFIGFILLSCFTTGGQAEPLKLERLFFTESERTKLDERGTEGVRKTDDTILSRVKDLSSDTPPEDRKESNSRVRFDGFYFENGVAGGINDESNYKHLPDNSSEKLSRSIKLWINGERWKPAYGDGEKSTAFRLTPDDPERSTEKIPVNVQQLTWLSEEKRILVELEGTSNVYLKPGDEIMVMSNGSVQKEN